MTQTLIIDGPYLAHRSYHAPYRSTTSDGRDATLVHTFLKTFLSFKKTYDPILIAWESHGTPSWRRTLYPSYKPQRQEIKKEYISQLKHTQAILNTINVLQYWSPGDEADDVIAMLTNICKTPVDIFTIDKDIYQLVNDKKGIRILDNKRKTHDETSVLEKFGVTPYQIPDYLALAGDTSDNIKGVPRIGPKTASKLLRKHKILEEVPLDREYRSITTLNRKLTRLNTVGDLRLLYTPKSLRDKLEPLLDHYEIRKIKEDILKCVKK